MWLFDKRKLHNVEYWLLIIIAVISLFGLVAILMTTADAPTGEEQGFFEFMSRLNPNKFVKQLIWIGVSFAAMAAVALLDYHIYSKIWYIIIAVSVGLIVYTSYFGVVRGGTRGWISIGGGSTEIMFQATEIGKTALILLLAKTLSKQEKIQGFKDLLFTFAVMAAFVGALLTQMDVGTSLVYVFVFICMLFIGGIPWKNIGIIAIVGVVALVGLWFLMGENQKGRITTFISGEESDQLKYAKVAIGSGGFSGKGILGENSITQRGYVAESETDFIFSVIGESFGFIGAFLLIVLYAILEIRMWMLMAKAQDRMGKLIIGGVMSMFMFHIFENIGMVTGLMPITGIPLPFVSYGGSNFLTNMICIGLVESVCINRSVVPFSHD